MGYTCINSTQTEVFELDSSPAPLPHLLAGLFIFLLILPCLLFQLRCLPVGSTTAALLGAFLMVISQVVHQHEAYEVLSRRESNTCIFLLISMMVLAHYFNREEIFMKLLRVLLKSDHSFANYIWRISLTVCLTSAIFTSDATCSILTPVILKLWEAQDRSGQELNTIILAIATSANIGSALAVFGSPHVALIACTTNMPAFSRSRLSLRICFLYLGPCVLLAFLLNLAFLMVHYRFRIMNTDKTQLISDVSHSEQEMASLTNTGPKTPVNGFAHYVDEDDTPETEQESNCDEIDEETVPPGGGGGGGYRESNTPPCTLETIPEDDILEIISEGPIGRSLNSLRALSGADVSCDLSAIDTIDNDSSDSIEDMSNLELNVPATDNVEDEIHGETFREHSPGHTSCGDIAYEPGALSGRLTDQSSRQQTPQMLHWAPSRSKNLERYGLLLSKKCGIYRSFSGVGAGHFLGRENSAELYTDDSAGTSRLFRVTCCLLVVTILVLFMISDLTVSFDMGLVPLAAAIVALTADAILNKRAAMATIEQLDWSVVMLFYGVFVWMHGFNKTNVIRWMWDRLLLTHSDYNSFSSIAFLCVFVLIATNFSNSFLVAIVLLNQLIPCYNQLSMVLFLTWASSVAGNMTLFGSVSNIIVIQTAQSVTRHRMSFWSHFQFGFLTTLVLLPLGVLLLFGLLQIP